MLKRTIYILLIVVSLISFEQARAQKSSIRGNALLLLSGTLNVGYSYDITRHWSFDVALSGNPIKTNTYATQIVMVQPGVRYWLRETNYSHFFSAYLNGGVYDMIFNKHSYKGFTAGLGISWGYHFPIKKRLNIGVEVGAGILFSRDKNFDTTIPESQDLYIYTTNRISFSPTKLEVSIVYLF